MFVSKVSILTVICLVSLADGKGDDSFSSTHKWPKTGRDTSIIVYSPIIDSTGVTWATCDHLDSWHTKPKCSIMRVINHFNGTGNTLSCKVDLAPKSDDVTIYGSLKVVTLGKDRAILASAQKLPVPQLGFVVKFSVIHFPTCNVIQNDLLYTNKEFSSYKSVFVDILDHLVTIAAHDDKYDVIHKNRTLCGDKLCIMSIDGHGKIESEPHPVPVEDFGQISVLNSALVSSNSVFKGLVLTQRDTHFKQENQVSLILPSGAKILKHINQSSEGTRPRITMSHNMIGFCDLIQSQFPDFDYAYFCAQYDQDGNLKKETIFNHSALREIKALYNLPRGGFLLLASQLVDKLYEDKIIRIDSEGKIVPFAFVVDGFSCEAKGLSSKDAFIFEKDERTICFSQACILDVSSTPHVPTLDFTVKCVPRNVLEKVLGKLN